MMMEAIRSSETSVLTIATRGKVPEDGIRHFLYWYLVCVGFNADASDILTVSICMVKKLMNFSTLNKFNKRTLRSTFSTCVGC
jgi:hypothetical protein